MTLTAERLRELLDYDPETGVFTWKAPRARRCKPGDVAGSPLRHGYWQICLYRKMYTAHRLAWLHHYGEWPDGDIDHMNGDKADNRIANLRKATRVQNMANVGLLKTNTSGLKGVSKCRKTGKWQARLHFNGKTHWLGLHECPAAASFAYQLAADQMRGEFHRVA